MRSVEEEQSDEGEQSDEEEDVASLLSTEVVLSQLGQQITDAESARNHVDFDKLGEHLDALFGFLSKLSVP